MNELFEQIKQETFLFTDDQIKLKIKELEDIHSNSKVKYIVCKLYDDKKMITKEEYYHEIEQYLYTNCFNSKEAVDKVIKDNARDFYYPYEKAIRGEMTYFHAVQYGRNQLIDFLNSKPANRDNDRKIPNKWKVKLYE